MFRTGRRPGPALWGPVLAFFVGAGMASAAVPGLATPGVTPLRTSPSASSSGRAVDGVALDPRGLALSGVEIRVAPLGVAGAPVMRALTDEGGRFTLGALAPGSYRLVAVKGGYGVLVGQINTLVEQTLELVLRPAGGPAAPGTRPEGIGWALRLPHRDPLEDRSSTFDGALDGPAAAAPFGPRIAVAVTGGRVEGDDESTTGKGIAVDLELFSDDSEHLGAHFDRHVEGGAGNAGWRETIDAFRIGRTTRSGRMPLSLALEVARHSTASGVGPDREDLFYDRVGFTLASSFAGRRDAADLRASLGFLQYDGQFDGVEAPAGTMRFDAAGSWRRVWGDTHDFGLDVAYAAMHRTDDRSAHPADVGTVGVPGGLLEGSLAAAYDDVAAIVVSDRWAAGPTLELIARGRADWTLDIETTERTTRGAATAGARWTALPGVALQAEGGVTVAGARSGEPIGAIAAQGQLASFGWSIGRSREIGPTTWDGFDSFDLGPAESFLVGDAAGVDRWTVDVAYAGSARLPHVSLRWSRMDVDGVLAPRLPLDLALVRTTEGEARADQAEIGVMIARTGSTVTLGWARMTSERGALLPGDAGTWERRGITIRQRVLGLSAGVLCEFILSADDARLAKTEDQVLVSTLRAAALERRRLTGGVALSF